MLPTRGRVLELVIGLRTNWLKKNVKRQQTRCSIKVE